MSELPAAQVIDLGPEPGRLTWYTLEHICELLRKHHRIEIRCGFDPFVSHLVTDVMPLRVDELLMRIVKDKAGEQQ